MQRNYSDLSQEAKQEFCDFIWKELNRHAEDIDQIRKDLQVMRDKYGIIPREIYVGNYIQVT